MPQIGARQGAGQPLMDYKRASQPETSWLNTSISCDPDPESLGQPSLFLNQTTTPFKNDYLNRSVEAQHSNFCMQEPTQAHTASNYDTLDPSLDQLPAASHDVLTNGFGQGSSSRTTAYQYYQPG